MHGVSDGVRRSGTALLLVLVAILGAPGEAKATSYRSEVLADVPWGYWRFEEHYNRSDMNCNGPGNIRGFPLYDEHVRLRWGDYCPSVTGPSSWTLDAVPHPRLNGIGVEVSNQKFRLGLGLTEAPPQSSSFSWEVWFKAAPDTASPMELMKWDYRTGTREFIVRVSSGQLQIRSDRDWGVSSYRDCGSVNISDGSWHHLVVARDLDNFRFRGFIDGQQACEQSIPVGTAWQYGGPAYYFFLGPSQSVPPDWHYFVDELSHYSHALSPIRVEAHYNGIDEDAAFLRAHVPEIRYDHDETFYANTVETITDWNGNRLIDGSGSALAQKPAGSGSGNLSIGWVRSTYPAGASATADDRLDENSDYEAAGQYFQGAEPYRDRVYGRLIPEADGSKWVQYWLWFYYNERGVPSGGEHEGDWEFAQYHYDSTGQLTEAVYDQHGHPETCPPEAMVFNSDGRPTIFTAVASHALYFTAGSHDVPGNPFNDRADGLGQVVSRPTVELLEGDASPAWLGWPGRWGGSSGLISADSPAGPQFGAHELQWTDPAAYAASAERSCQERGEGPTGAAASYELRAAVPRVQARREGRRVTVGYEFDHFDAPEYAWAVVDPIGDRATPVSGIGTVDRDGRGAVTFKLGRYLDRAADVRVSALARDGRRGKAGLAVVR